MATLNTYISMLRGINVSGQKSIKMTDLKALCESLHLTSVTTYIQSGNVVFRSTVSDPVVIADAIEKAIAKAFGFAVSVVVRKPPDFRKVLARRPSLGTTRIDDQRLYVCFLKSMPGRLLVKTVSSMDYKSEDSFKISGSEIYIYCPDGFGKTIFSNTFFEKQLKVTATTRNWKTVRALLDISSEIESSRTRQKG